ncbi:MAG: helix-turn-helix transcriptional regulator [Chloroflexi bacterium]|nr:helix-turn-helix transcriptional regulator [Chloroflexota bacterium]
MGRKPDALRERLRQERRREILAAAGRIFAQKGFEKATTREIAALAGIAEGTIYNYFQGKRDLLISLLGSLVTESLQEALTAELFNLDEQSFLANLIGRRLESITSNADMLLVLFQQIMVDDELRRSYFTRVFLPVTTQLEAYFQARMDKGIYRQTNARMVARATVGAFVMNFVVPTILGERAMPGPERKRLAGELVDFLIGGLAPRPAPTGGTALGLREGSKP